MQHYSTQTQHLVVLKKGEEVHEQLESFAKTQTLSTTWVTMIGGANEVTLGLYDPEQKTYLWQTFREPLEIVSLSGNLTIVDGEPFYHLHGVFSRRDFSCVAGHVKFCVIGLTGEALITPLDLNVTRAHDKQTGLRLICPPN